MKNNSEKNNDNEIKKYNIYKLLCAVLLVILIVVLCLWAKSMLVEKNSEDIYKEWQQDVNKPVGNVNEGGQLQDTSTENDSEGIISEEISSDDVELGIEIPQKNIDWDKLHSANKDIYAWIYIPGTKVDYPIVQNKNDNSYYLNHNIDGSKGKPGCIYTENINSKEFTDYNTVIYGHNMKSGSMFSTLHDFESRNFFDENQYVFIYTEEKVYVYEVFAAYTSDNKHILNTNDFSSQEGAQKYIEKIYRDAANGNVREDVAVTGSNALITLSTCSSASDERYLVQAVLINE